MKKIKLLIIILEFLLSFLIHNLYDLYPCTLFSIFFPVNESIFEHIKIISTAILVSSLIEVIIYKFKNIKYNNFILSVFIQIIIGIAFYLILFIPIYLIFGENLFISLSILLITFIFTNYISYSILRYEHLNNLNKTSIFLIMIIYVIFGYFTYNPITNFFFYDTVNSKYGINIYTI